MIITSQVRAVDPFSSYESDNVNKITRVLTAGEDRIIRDTDLLPTKLSNTSINVSAGVCVKDDVMLHVTTDETFDVTLASNYIEGSLIPSGGADAYLVLVYQYVKTPVVPVASIKLLKTLANFNTELYVFLGMVRFSNTNVIDQIYTGDTVRGVYRMVANFTDAYTDQRARNAQATNPITNHLPCDSTDYGKVVCTDDTDGSIEYVDKSTIFGGLINLDLEKSVDYPGGTATVVHNKGYWPHVTLVDLSNYQVFVAYDITHSVDKNSFIIDFYNVSVAPANVTVIY